ncbi:MAG: tetratricopeptide repeat protein [Longimicrobiales bacterium]
MNWRSLFVLPVLMLVGAWVGQPLQAQTQDYLRGNELYQAGDYAGAIGAYQAVLDEGFVSAELHYNLGNAHFRNGSPHLAVLNYERAARLDPGNSDVVENLRLARLQLADRIEPLPRFFLLTFVDWWIRLVPRSLLIALTSIAYLATGVGLASWVLGRPRGWGKSVRRLSYVFGLMALLLGGTLLLRETRLGAPTEAIVMAPEVSVLSAPSADGGLTLFSLHAGAKVRIDQTSGEWVEVVLQDGKVGWLPQQVLEPI